MSNKIKLLEEHPLGHKRKYLLNNGVEVLLEKDDFNEYIYIYKMPERERIGEFEFRCSYDYGNSSLHLTRMFSGITGQGIGKEILEWVIESSGATIYTTQNDGIPRDDGSHLTGDAPMFVESMRKKGLIKDTEVY